MKPHLSAATLASAAVFALVVVSVPWTMPLLAQQQSPRGARPPAPRGAGPLARPGDLPAWIDLEREHRAGRVVFRMEDGRDEKARAAVMRSVGATSGRVLWPGLLFELTLPENRELRAALVELDADPRVEYAQPSFVYRTIGVPNDPDFWAQWGFDQANDADIDAPEAWDVATDASSVVVAVIDTGVQYDHPDLAANMWINPDEIAGNGLDDDGNGYVDDVHGADVVNLDGDPMDDHYHGTHVAGTIGAVTDNGVGVAGTCRKAKIMAMKFLDASGSGDTAGAILAFDYAVKEGAQVSNNSWGGYGHDQALYDAMDAAGDACHLAVCAAGNNSIDIEGQDWIPGGFDLDNIIDVAATNSSDGLAWFSNWGATSVDLGAPGDGIWSTFLGSTYAYLSGTSMASPHVTGVATMLFAHSGSHDDQVVKNWILDSVDPLAALAGITVTGGRLNFRAALDLIPPPATLPASGLLLSLRESTTLGGVAITPGDVFHVDPTTGLVTMVLQAGDVLAAPPNVDAVAALSDASLLISFADAVTIPCLKGGPNGDLVEDEDVVRFVPLTYGDSTSGGFEFWFDGSDVGLDKNGEDVDGLAVDALGNLLVSTSGRFNVSGLVARNEDVVLFAPTSLGKDTAGTWTLFFNGRDADVKLASPGENVDAVDYDDATATLMLSTGGDFRVPVNVFGQDDDVLNFAGTLWGTNTDGTFTVALDGATLGLDPLDIDALDALH